MAFQLVKGEKVNQDYRGPAEACLYTFTVNLPDQLGSRWSAEQHLNATMTELLQHGSVLLEYRLWEDKLSGIFTTDYKCEIVASASPLWWNLIILGVIGLLALLVTTWAISKVGDIAEYSPGAATGISIGMIAIAAVILAGLVLTRRRE